MNGVTGRMGYRQHLVRSVLAIRDEGGVPLPDGTRLQVEPVLVGRNARQARRDRRPARHRRLHHRPRRGARRRAATIYFDAQVTRRAQGRSCKAMAAGKHVYTEKPIAESRRGGAGAGRRGRGGRHHERRRARQALPARPAQAEAAGRRRLLRPDPVGARRVRLLGVRGRLAAGPAAELELPRRGRRRHRPRHVLPLELRAGEPVRPGRGGDAPRPSPTSRSAGTSRASPTRPRPTTPRTRSSSWTAAIIAQINSSWAVRVDRDELVEFQVDGMHGSAVAGLFGCRDPAPRRHPEAGVEPRRADRPGLPRPVAGGARQPGVRQRVPRAVGAVPPRRRRRPPAPLRLPAGARGLRLVEAALRSLGRGPPGGAASDRAR